MLLHDDELWKLVHYRVEKKGQREKARLDRLFQYDKIDKDTKEILGENHCYWMEHPSAFWNRPSPLVMNSFDPQIQIVGRYLQTHRDNA